MRHLLSLSLSASRANVQIITRGTRSLGYCFVTYENESDAQKAVSTLNKRVVQGREINVEGAKPQEELAAAREAKQAAKKEAKAAKAAERKQQQDAKAAAAALSGETPNAATAEGAGSSEKKKQKSRSARTRAARERRPRADDGEEADKAPADGETAAAVNGESSTPAAKKRQPRAKKAANGEASTRQPRGPKGAPEGEPSKTLVFVANLSYEVDDASLKQAFEGLSVSTATVVRRQFGAKRSKGYGFVDFASEQDQQQALSQFNGKDWQGRPLSLKVAIQGSREQADKESKDEATAATTTQAPSTEAA